MREFGLDVDLRGTGSSGPTLSTEQLRALHRVEWRLGNLASDRLAERPADLVLCNNVVYHYRDQIDAANAITANLAENLAPGGTVSFGANLASAFMDGWVLGQATPMLAERGIVPVLSEDPYLVAFQNVPDLAEERLAQAVAIDEIRRRYFTNQISLAEAKQQARQVIAAGTPTPDSLAPLPRSTT